MTTPLTPEDIFDRLMALWQEPWSESAFGEARMLVSRLRQVLTAARSRETALREALAEAHWALVNWVDRTDEAYLALLDRIEPIVDAEAADRADAALTPPTEDAKGDQP